MAHGDGWQEDGPARQAARELRALEQGAGWSRPQAPTGPLGVVDAVKPAQKARLRDIFQVFFAAFQRQSTTRRYEKRINFGGGGVSAGAASTAWGFQLGVETGSDSDVAERLHSKKKAEPLAIQKPPRFTWLNVEEAPLRACGRRIGQWVERLCNRPPCRATK